ncbi:MAG: hypothetical protein Q8L35_09520 [Actinomycetota bacterium]|nr:hypothetical protein [Actinomycetota bacterium]
MSEEQTFKTPWYKRWWAIAGIAFIIGVSVGASSSESSQKPAEIAVSDKTATVNIDSLRQENESLKKEKDAALAKATEAATTLKTVRAELDGKVAAEKQVEAEKSKTTFSDGVYLVGTDIPAGRYKGTPSGSSAYWQVSGDANGENIIANGNEPGNFYVQASAGQYVEIKGAEISLAQ